MTLLALVLRACVLLHIREPMEFYALSEQAQRLWLEYARDDFTGAWLKVPAKTRAATIGAAEREREAIERMRAREGGRGTR